MFKNRFNGKHKMLLNSGPIPGWRRAVYVAPFMSFMALTSCGQGAGSARQAAHSTVAAVVSPSQGIQADSLARQMARTVMTIWKDPTQSGQHAYKKWSYDEGVVLKGFENIWMLSGDPLYFNYIQHSMDDFVDKNGVIRDYDSLSYKLDDINNGKLLLTLARVTGKKQYWKAATSLRNQLNGQPRTFDGGFWHKKIYPNQMWLDGLYMAAPFYAEYAMVSGEDTAFNDIGKQFVLMERHARDSKTGLLYHGWDASKEQKWANKQTGLSENFWGRAMGWYGMALVDALDYFPENQPYKDSLVQILNRYATAVVKVQDRTSHVWWQVLDKAGDAGNYQEASASCMFVYTLAKGVRKGYLPASYDKAALDGFEGVVKQFVARDSAGNTVLNGTCEVAGLGGKPYRDGTYQYYIGEKTKVNDGKGVGAFLLAATEIQMAADRNYGVKAGKTTKVLLDNFYNNETKVNLAGITQAMHYTFNDRENSGFSLWGDVFESLGARTATLRAAPTRENLKGAAVYMIVDPDTDKETSSPNYVDQAAIENIKAWVKEGGILVLMENDSLNAEFDHFNQLAESFGVHFDGNSLNRVQGHQYEQGAIDIAPDDSIFSGVKQVYIKELSSITLKDPAQAILKTKDGHVAGSLSHFGKGMVLAIGDPWLYNEYVDGRKLPLQFENYKAMRALSKWLLKNSR
ncbi:unsaturated rhamnogalacturonyl hydrolase [Arachidicoccus rhizosphaerae]|uniref:Unsaturated rhamnogalacturonyl hydrolase n=1 Tax=Arachidicoccus rhizosphaerae TaxID=551991 RepID=A0A1H4ARC2_9BACT|nr:glycoside hydrolase family 88 protein [Arachidicoccus rhizosphaerae]SEA38284.1 unsaturated rhamnogalacturonyl hydrolase [Arachidicoccus rhizosphaerae]